MNAVNLLFIKGEMRNMAATKYGKYILKPATKKNTPRKPTALTPIVLEGLKDWGGIKHRMKWSFVSQPVQFEEEPHTHDFDEFLCFLGCDPTNQNDFGAEIELALGREGEKQIIKAPTIVCIPRGLIHGPLNVRTVNKPFLFAHIYIAPQYVRKPAS
jgi:hypothetical protein